ncbi:hypothetical protein [Novosphingobium sp.]|uniref:hypothetical protein n=1 Tax=Novosphingobium sp. TaxID=1874826 RepID=UPI00333F9A69
MITNTMRKPAMIAAVASFAVLALAGNPAMAGEWGRHHPRQHEVLARAHHQMKRINHERREGELSGPQARALRQNERAIVRQERADARMHGGHITRHEQRQLNREENAQGRVIGH